MQAAPPSAHAAPHPAAHRTVDVAIATADGTFVVRLDAERAPLTTANFLRYVDSHAYDGATFYRVVTRATKPDAPFEVIQGGNEKRGGANGTPIPLEPTSKTELHNDDGTIAMARPPTPTPRRASSSSTSATRAISTTAARSRRATRRSAASCAAWRSCVRFSARPSRATS